jgi:hypothetical protein
VFGRTKSLEVLKGKLCECAFAVATLGGAWLRTPRGRWKGACRWSAGQEIRRWTLITDHTGNGPRLYFFLDFLSVDLIRQAVALVGFAANLLHVFLEVNSQRFRLLYEVAAQRRKMRHLSRRHFMEIIYLKRKYSGRLEI